MSNVISFNDPENDPEIRRLKKVYDEVTRIQTEDFKHDLASLNGPDDPSQPKWDAYARGKEPGTVTNLPLGRTALTGVTTPPGANNVISLPVRDK